MKFSKKWLPLLVGVLALGVFAAAALAKAPPPPTNVGYHTVYTGQGFYNDRISTPTLIDERCGVGQDANDGSTGLFADWNGEGKPYETGQGYLVWVYTLKNATPPVVLTLPDGPHPMVNVGGTYKYASQYWDLADLLKDPPITYADGTAPSGQNVNLVVSHGCKPLEDKGTWCSPGFWRNADANAWAQTINPAADPAAPYAPTDLFNNTAYDFWFGSMLGSAITLQNVLGSPSTYGGPPNAGTSGFALNAYNAVGAMLTDGLPGYMFDFSLYESGTDNCPIDNHGVWKTTP